jgi:hypothetical protein
MQLRANSDLPPPGHSGNRRNLESATTMNKLRNAPPETRRYMLQSFPVAETLRQTPSKRGRNAIADRSHAQFNLRIEIAQLPNTVEKTVLSVREDKRGQCRAFPSIAVCAKTVKAWPQCYCAQLPLPRRANHNRGCPDLEVATTAKHSRKGTNLITDVSPYGLISFFGLMCVCAPAPRQKGGGGLPIIGPRIYA